MSIYLDYDEKVKCILFYVVVQIIDYLGIEIVIGAFKLIFAKIFVKYYLSNKINTLNLLIFTAGVDEPTALTLNLI